MCCLYVLQACVSVNRYVHGRVSLEFVIMPFLIDSMRSMRPPALTTGLFLFCLLINLLGLLDDLDLTPTALFEFNLNRLSFYTLVCRNTESLLLSYLFLAPLLGQYELRNGTVRAGIVLNIATFIPGVLSNLICKITNYHIMDYVFYGPTTLMLTFAAFLSVNNWPAPRVTIRGMALTLPSAIIPFVMYFVFLIFEFRFWFLYTLALGMGFGLGLGPLGFLVEPTTNVVEWIEERLSWLIVVLKKIVDFVTEIEARERRETNFRSLAVDTVEEA